jgi:hypothetical protein
MLAPGADDSVSIDVNLPRQGASDRASTYVRSPPIGSADWRQRFMPDHGIADLLDRPTDIHAGVTLSHHANCRRTDITMARLYCRDQNSHQRIG